MCAFSADSALLAAWDPRNDASDNTVRVLQLSSGQVHELSGRPNNTEANNCIQPDAPYCCYPNIGYLIITALITACAILTQH